MHSHIMLFLSSENAKHFTSDPLPAKAATRVDSRSSSTLRTETIPSMDPDARHFPSDEKAIEVMTPLFPSRTILKASCLSPPQRRIKRSLPALAITSPLRDTAVAVTPPA